MHKLKHLTHDKSHLCMNLYMFIKNKSIFANAYVLSKKNTRKYFYINDFQ